MFLLLKEIKKNGDPKILLIYRIHTLQTSITLLDNSNFNNYRVFNNKIYNNFTSFFIPPAFVICTPTTISKPFPSVTSKTETSPPEMDPPRSPSTLSPQPLPLSTVPATKTQTGYHQHRIILILKKQHLTPDKRLSPRHFYSYPWQFLMSVEMQN